MTSFSEGTGPATISKHRSRVTGAGKVLVLAGLCALLLTACPRHGSGPKMSILGDPGGLLYVRNFDEVPGLPFTIGPYHRDVVTAYRPEQRYFIVRYNAGEVWLEASSTVHFYALDAAPSGADRTLAGQFANASESVRQAHPGAALIEQSRDVIAGGGATHDILSATYRFEGPFDGKTRVLASEIQVLLVGDHFVKFRHSYPWEDREVMAPQVDEFMRQLGWSEPAAVTTHLLSLTN